MLCKDMLIQQETYIDSVRNGVKIFTVQCVANKRNKSEYICFLSCQFNRNERAMKTRSNY